MADQHTPQQTRVAPDLPPKLAAIAHLFTDQMPFNRSLGLSIPYFTCDKVEVHFAMHEGLIGNPIQRILHGGVTASVLDVAGGLIAIANFLEKSDTMDQALLNKKLAKMGTIDMRVDYLRPGRGEHFVASAEVIRSGSRVSVCRMELHNEKGSQIAFGTGAYMMG
ncbi:MULTISPECIES: thioesterase family protein [Corallincola]|uniref:Thioesterase family protein n=3 Tax=Corallincola TaxID=1775176 RepID=A0A368N5X3_9GAMM|nr:MULTISPECIES: thioesterase family protein [Corallincola]RCU45540.1 thioesterase family protein [Corallincola holothuriorum]TAA40965.1 thioesterase family protein [Corallincola spongiicola]TCI02597.1 thioesterase family protein [Corallincola luteus]